MADRYFLETPIAGEHATLQGSQAHHLLHVMRVKVGDAVMLFDGSGAELTARVQSMGRNSLELAVLARKVVDRELAVAITIGVALPKGDRQKWLVEKLTELGAARLVPLETHRGVAQPLSSAIDRLHRTVIEASKQCRRNRLMKIAAPQTLEQFVTDVESPSARLIAHPGGEAMLASFDRLRRDYANGDVHSIAIAIGPEGGFADEELAAAAAAGWTSIDLGARILRVETAAVAWASIAGLLTARSHQLKDHFNLSDDVIRQ